MSERVAKNTVILFVGQILALGLNMITVVILARYWGESLFGIFSYGLVLVGLFALPADFGIKPILVRELSRQRQRASEIMASALGLKIGLTIFTILLVNGVSFFVFPDQQIRTVVLILSFMIPFTSKVSTLRIVFESIFHADMEMKIPVAFQMSDALLQMILVLVFVRLSMGFNAILVVYGAALLPGFIGCVIMASRRVQLRIAFQKKWIVWFLKESTPLFIYIGFAMLYERLDVLLLNSFTDEAHVGIYSSAFRLTAPLIFFPFAVTSALYPVMSRIIEGEEKKGVLIFSMGLKVLFIVGLALGLFGLIAGAPLYRTVYAGGFMGGLVAFQLLLWSQAFNFLTYFIVDYNSSQNRQKKNALFILCILALALVVDTILISRFGVPGAGAAKLLLNIIGVVILVILSKRGMMPFQIRASIKVFLILLVFMMVAGGLEMLETIWTLKTFLMVLLWIAGSLTIFSPGEKHLLFRGLKTLLHPSG